MSSIPTVTEAYREFRALTDSEVLPRSLRTATFVFFVIQTVFILVDWLLFRVQFWDFLPVRLALNAAFALVYLRAARAWPRVSTLAVCWLGGGMLLLVTAGTGAGSSGYYVGLVLLFVGLGVLLPLRSQLASVILGALYAAYLAIGMASEPIEWGAFGLHLFFLGAACFCGVMSCGLIDRMRFTDFLQRREIESARDELAQLDSAKAKFTANIHHELRTPLTLILAPLDALRGGDLGEVPEALGPTFRTMQSNGLRLLKLINDLLDLAKIESGQLSVARTLIDPFDVVSGVVDGARPMAERKGIVLRAQCLGPAISIHADRDALEKVIVNLVGNALKFTEQGSVEIRVSACQEGDRVGPGGVHIEVADTGIGIPPEQLGKIFDRFAQVDGSATRRHEGTGIGLSLVSELVELHGGRVWAESEGEGRGATLHVVLPCGEADREEAEEVLLSGSEGRALDARRSFEALASGTSIDFDETGAAREGQRVEMERSVGRWEGRKEGGPLPQAVAAHPEGTPEVVIAEDNGEMRELLSFLIGREFAVRECRNGREALEAVRERKPMLVVTDVMMPEMSGTELCRAIKQDEELRGVPVMLVTSKAEREMKIEGLELGADDYVTKPFHPRELLARVRSLVRVRQLQEEIAGQNKVLEESNRALSQALADLKDAEVQLVQSERMAAVGELSAGVAHEVNNPLNYARNSLAALRAHVQDLQDVAAAVGRLDPSDPEALRAQLGELERKKDEVRFDELAGDLSELVQIVTQGLDRTSRLVGELRDFAAPHRGEHAPVDINASVESTLQLTGHVLRESRCQVVTHLAAGLPIVLGDPGALNQVFLNLLKNAAEAIDAKGGGTVTVTTAEQRGHVQVLVHDDGLGMDSEVKSRLFEPFFTTKEAGQGTGLGLSLCRRIISEHGGEILAESARGEGTTLIVRLPVEPSSRAETPGAA